MGHFENFFFTHLRPFSTASQLASSWRTYDAFSIWHRHTSQFVRGRRSSRWEETALAAFAKDFRSNALNEVRKMPNESGRLGRIRVQSFFRRVSIYSLSFIGKQTAFLLVSLSRSLSQPILRKATRYASFIGTPELT